MSRGLRAWYFEDLGLRTNTNKVSSSFSHCPISSIIQGVTLEGTIWSAIGGAIIGLSTAIFDYFSWLAAPLVSNTVRLVAFGTACGLIGSIIDSLLGATLQQTYWDDNKKLIFHANGRPESAKLLSGLNILTNEQVNFVSLVLTTTLAGWVLGPLIFS